MIELYKEFLLLSQQNPMVASLIGIWAATMLTFLTKDIPKKIYVTAKRFMFLNLTFMDHGWFYDSVQYNNFNEFIAKRITDVSSFSYGASARNGNRHGSFVLTPYLGTHWFWFNKKLFWYSISHITSTGGEKQKQKMTLTCFSWNKKTLENMFDEFKHYHLDHKAKDGIYSHGADGWAKVTSSSDKSFDDIIIDSKLKNTITERIDFFLNNKDFYKKKNLPYKLSMMLHGKSGTGKTSIIKALCTYTNRPLYILEMSRVAPTKLSQLVASCTGGILVIEDVDRSGIVNTKQEPIEEDDSSNQSSVGRDHIGIIMNAFDGLIEPNDVIIIFTTNHIDKIDEAMLRPGRIDCTFEIGTLSCKTVKENLYRLYDNVSINENFEPIAGADLMKLYSENSTDFESFKYHLINDERR